MIKTVTLTNFRQHRDRTFTFEQGLNALRGPNENGKSTVMEAITYALFGARAARNNDLTSWGEPEGTHRVVLTMTFNGVDYTLTRSQRGAELTFEDQRVTGQNDVTAFMEQLLDLKPRMGDRLMLASQNDIRGVLSAGGADTARMIETLANFDLIDTVITRLQERETVGKADWLDSQIELLRGQLHDLVPCDPPEEKVRKSAETEHRAGLSMAEEMREQATQEIAERKEKIKAERERIASMEEAKQARDAAVTTLEQARQTLASLSVDGNLEELISSLAKCDEEVEAAQFIEGRNDLLQQYGPLVDQPCVEGSRQSFEERLAGLKGRDQALRNQLQQNFREKTRLEAEQLNGSCSFCGQDFSNVPEVIARNAEIGMKLAALLEAETAAKEEQGQVQTEISEIEDILSVADPKLYNAAGLFDLDYNFTPAKVTQKVDVQRVESGLELLQAKRQEVLASIKALQAAETTRRLLCKQMGEAEQVLQSVEEVTAEDLQTRRTNLEQLQQVLSISEKKLEKADELEQNTERKWRDFQVQQERLQRQFDAYVENRGKLEKNIEDLEKNRSKLAFNNELLKRLRNVKPEIANKVWESVLGAISRYFSAMRGTHSKVSRSGSDFLVDDRPVESLSGSTLDILGLAIRVALVRTFLPNSRILLLDEPFAGCDAVRQGASLGFLLGLGFDQVLVITHEVNSETVASNIIEV